MWSKCLYKIKSGISNVVYFVAFLTWTENTFPIKIDFSKKSVSILLDKVDGVQTVKNLSITNKSGVSSGYSQYAYDLSGATLNGIIYPSLDPSIFEVKNLSTDIKGRVVSY